MTTMPDLPDTDRSPSAWTNDDVTRLVAAHAETREFERFVLARFIAYSHTPAVPARTREGRDTVIEEPVTGFSFVGNRLRGSNGWETWNVDQSWLTNPEATSISVYHFLADDRGPGMKGMTIQVPKAWIFGEIEATEDYQTYLRLKDRFEGPEYRTQATADTTPE